MRAQSLSVASLLFLLASCNSVLGNGEHYLVDSGAGAGPIAKPDAASGAAGQSEHGEAGEGGKGGQRDTSGAGGQSPHGEAGEAGLGGASGADGGEAAAACGDGKVDVGEGCDDGNSASGDGCFGCAVESGFSCNNTRSPSTCSDVNECDLLKAPCDPNATCKNAVGSFSCTCNTGYVGDGKACTRPSCAGLAATCGASSNDDCCSSPTVTGGTFKLGGSSGAPSATVSTFTLDKYEVTVGRFRNFVNAYAGAPAAGAGAHPLIAGSGWLAAWNSSISSSKAALTSAVACDTVYQTYSASVHDPLPMNCVNWYEAFAFCAWDGGRLPTEAEWEYAAAGGAEERLYPWGNSPTLSNAVDSTTAYANYDYLGDNAATSAFTDLLPAGSKPLGVGKYGQMDLAGSMWEWVLDWYAPFPGSACIDCADLTPAATRTLRGGGWRNDASNQTAVHRNSASMPNLNYFDVGLRCAHSH